MKEKEEGRKQGRKERRKEKNPQTEASFQMSEDYSSKQGFAESA